MSTRPVRVQPLSTDDAHDAGHAVGGVTMSELRHPWRGEAHQLVEDTANGPRVSGLRVWLALDHLRRHIQRRATLCLCQCIRDGQDLRDAKIANLDAASCREKDVGGLQIAMEEFEVMVAVGEAEAHLMQHAEELGLREAGAQLLST